MFTEKDSMKALKIFLVWINLLAFGILGPSQAAADEASPYDAHGRRDPFVALVTGGTQDASGLLAVETLDDAVIEGVVYDPKNGSIVIINGTLLKQGETAGNVKVIEIRTDGAVLSVNGTDAFIPMQTDPATRSRRS